MNIPSSNWWSVESSLWSVESSLRFLWFSCIHFYINDVDLLTWKVYLCCTWMKMKLNHKPISKQNEKKIEANRIAICWLQNRIKLLLLLLHDSNHQSQKIIHFRGAGLRLHRWQTKVNRRKRVRKTLPHYLNGTKSLSFMKLVLWFVNASHNKT